MENSDSFTEQETLGSLFRRIRLERSLDIADVSDETRIPQHTVRAIEADDYAELPAHAFARGFYTIYAQMLDLDPEELLQRYTDECSGSYQSQQQEKLQSPSWQHGNIGTMAERPSITPGSIIGLSLLIIILTSAGISWYAGYNPATNISKWLRSLQNNQPAATQPQPNTPATDLSITYEKDDITTEQTEDVPVTQTSEEPSNIQYRLAAEFRDGADLTITIDDNAPIRMALPPGAVETWHAQKALVLEMASGTYAKLSLNDIAIPIPEPQDEKIIIEIPEYLLDSDVNYSN